MLVVYVDAAPSHETGTAAVPAAQPKSERAKALGLPCGGCEGNCGPGCTCDCHYEDTNLLPTPAGPVPEPVKPPAREPFITCGALATDGTPCARPPHSDFKCPNDCATRYAARGYGWTNAGARTRSEGQRRRTAVSAPSRRAPRRALESRMPRHAEQEGIGAMSARYPDARWPVPMWRKRHGAQGCAGCGNGENGRAPRRDRSRSGGGQYRTPRWQPKLPAPRSRPGDRPRYPAGGGGPCRPPSRGPLFWARSAWSVAGYCVIHWRQAVS